MVKTPYMVLNYSWNFQSEGLLTPPGWPEAGQRTNAGTRLRRQPFSMQNYLTSTSYKNYYYCKQIMKQ